MKTNQQFLVLALLVALFAGLTAQAQGVLQRKWNPQAKGTAMGAGVGGAAGAIINKRNRVVGAGIGMAAGAAAGYAIGKGIDNRRRRAAAAARAAENREYAARTARVNQTNSGSGTSERVSARRVGLKTAAAGGAYALTQNPLPAQTAPPSDPFTRDGYLLNTAYGDANSAYPNSEYRRKSW